MPTSVSNLQGFEEYRATRAQVFASEQSLRWFVRKHRARLIEVGALLCPVGSLLIDPERFDAIVVSVGQERVSALGRAD